MTNRLRLLRQTPYRVRSQKRNKIDVIADGVSEASRI